MSTWYFKTSKLQAVYNKIDCHLNIDLRTSYNYNAVTFSYCITITYVSLCNHLSHDPCNDYVIYNVGRMARVEKEYWVV